MAAGAQRAGRQTGSDCESTDCGSVKQADLLVNTAPAHAMTADAAVMLVVTCITREAGPTRERSAQTSKATKGSSTSLAWLL